MRVQIDRFEDDGWAVLLPYPGGDRGFDVPGESLPEGVAKGDVPKVSVGRDRAETGLIGAENRRLSGVLPGGEG